MNPYARLPAHRRRAAFLKLLQTAEVEDRDYARLDKFQSRYALERQRTNTEELTHAH